MAAARVSCRCILPHKGPCHPSLSFTNSRMLSTRLCIGVGTAIFSIGNAVLIQPLPYRDSSRDYLENQIKQQKLPSAADE